jgi:CRP/FNR family cyclic AMP-dependent transcriptional regulator
MQQKILLVEDDDPLRENTTELLELNKYKVYTARDGREGVKQVLSNQPDVILCDIMMPEMDGFSFLKFIRSNPLLSHTYFIFFSANAQKNEIQQGLDFGANDYLVKPFTETELLSCLEKYNQQSTRKHITAITRADSEKLV